MPSQPRRLMTMPLFYQTPKPSSMPDGLTLPAYTPFPSRLLDTVMPTLSDTEWRVLCIVVRSTCGWEDGQRGRKAQDWLTQSQLKQRTGRASEAISRAIDGLVQKGLILVCDEVGKPLATPQERRRCTGRMLFCMSPQTLVAPQEASGGVGASPQSGAAEERAGDQATSSSISKEGYSQNEHRRSESEQSYSISEARYSVSEVRKANTTKETKDKTTPDGVTPQKRADGDKPVDNFQTRKASTDKDTASQRAGSDVQRFLGAYQELFQQHSAQGELPPMAWGRDGKLVKGLLAQYGYERLRELLARFFASEDAWVRKRGYALACFPTLLPTLLMQDGRTLEAQGRARETQGQEQARTRVEEAQRRALATPVVVHGPSAQHWQQAGDSTTSSASLFERYPHLRKKAREQPP